MCVFIWFLPAEEKENTLNFCIKFIKKNPFIISKSKTFSFFPCRYLSRKSVECEWENT